MAIDLSFIGITGLALADSVNPCAIAVLTILLVAIISYNPKNKTKVLVTGLSFVAAIYIGYMFYGTVIVNFFKVLDTFLRQHSAILFNALGVIALIIGALNIKDYFMYKPGGLGTEMPLFMRPKVKKIINGVTSAKGAFIIGFLVTLFLLPCTMGPLVVASGLLSELPLYMAILWLLYYNILFVLPMLFIIGLVTYGFAKVEDISGWKERNIRKLHLVAGILLILIGAGLLTGLLSL